MTAAKARAVVALATALAQPTIAHAGGFELFGNGAEATGRGGAFSAKADDLSALEYNVAGLAAQHGTRLQVGGSLFFQDYSFARSGQYPGDPTDPATPYAGRAYPTIHNTGDPQAVPFLGVSTDFGFFRRFTFALALAGPSAIGNRSFPSTVRLDGGTVAPAPQRYDLLRENLVLIVPTLAAAMRITRWLDIGLSLSVYYARFDFTAVSWIDLGRSSCPSYEYAPCDSATEIVASTVVPSLSGGLSVRPTESLALALQVRGPVDFDADGGVHATAPPGLKVAAQSGDAHFQTHLPWALRLGARYRFLRGTTEAADLELDGTYEAWRAAEGGGDRIDIPELGIFSNLAVTILHRYQDTFSMRLGGAYNWLLGTVRISARGGVYFDTPATSSADTRLDFDTLLKVGASSGLGISFGRFGFDLGYAYLYSPDRLVKDGEIRPTNATTGKGTDLVGQPLPPVNNGRYHSATQILSASVRLAWQ